MELTLENLTKAFGVGSTAVTAVDDISLNINSGEFVAFLGPSGCGKTTTLLMLAGIYRPTKGTIRFDSKIMNRIPPQKRNIGMVFQSYALYPHMSALENMSFPLRLAGASKHDQKERVQKVANLMGIGNLLDRRPGQLSGGQQQRVALGRALVKEPSLLLFDEPLSNLDARLRLVMRGEIKRLQNQLGITAIYVTHDQVEALTMADRIAVIMEGRLQAFDTPDDIYNCPRTQFIAGFVGNPPMNFFSVNLSTDNGQYIARSKDGQFKIQISNKQANLALINNTEQASMVLGIRPEDISIAEVEGTGSSGKVISVEPLGRDNLLGISCGSITLFLLSSPENSVSIGQNIELVVERRKVQLFDPKTEQSLLWR